MTKKPKALDWTDRISLGKHGQVFEPVGAWNVFTLTADGYFILTDKDFKIGDRLYVYKAVEAAEVANVSGEEA